jgi:hypothetical protein
VQYIMVNAPYDKFKLVFGWLLKTRIP